MIFKRSFMVDVAANCREVLERIGETASRCGRNPKEIKLLAAAKSQPVDKIRAAVEAGVRIFGENYAQEAAAKRSAVGGAIEWHMIGHLQRNKARMAFDLFDVIQSLDSLELARALDNEGRRKERRARAFVEINLAAEESKNGVAGDRAAPLLEEIGNLSYIKVEGLMAVPPFRDDPEESRPYFRALRELRDGLTALKISNVDLKEISMGMSHDYTVAIEEGATLVRIGTAIFGPRSL